jgi:hypothetical protein
MLRKLKDLVIRDRNFKVGDVFRWVPRHGQKAAESRGFGIVIDVDGSFFKAYWTGDERIREHDLRLVYTSFILQDYAPMPEVAEVLSASR